MRSRHVFPLSLDKQKFGFLIPHDPSVIDMLGMQRSP